MKNSVFCLFFVGTLSLTALHSASIENPGFEDGKKGWVISGDSGISDIVSEGARAGSQKGLVVKDEKPDRGSSVASARFSVQGGRHYSVSWWGKVLSGSGIAIYFRYYDAAGKILNEGKNTAEFKDPEWKKYSIRAESPASAVEADVWVRSYVSAVVTAHLDDFQVEEVPLKPAQDPARLDRKRAPTDSERAAMAAMRKRWKDLLTGGGSLSVTDEFVKARLETAAKSGGDLWKSMTLEGDSLWRDTSNLKDAAQVSRAYSRLRSMALAYALPGTSLSGDPALVRDTLRGLEWLHANVYNETKGDVGSWYEREIGTPLNLNDILVLLRDEIPAERREMFLRSIYHFAGHPAAASYDLIEVRRGYEYVGANRVWRCLNLMLAAASREDPEKCALAAQQLGEVFDYVTTGEGWYRDGSFIAHNRHPYNGGYGKSLFIQMANLFHLTAGSPWESGPKASADNIYHWVYEGLEPLLIGDSMMDMIRGREIARVQAPERVVGLQVLQAIFRLSLSAPENHRVRLHAIIKNAVGLDGQSEILKNAPIDLILPLKTLLADRSTTLRQEVSKHKRYPSMDRVVHRRPGFTMGLSMFSSRIYNFEYGNTENARGWFTSQGALYLYPAGISQFGSDFWPTVDSYRIPGTTVDKREKKEFDFGEASKTSDRAWVGGVDLRERYGSTGMDLHAIASRLEAKKSWFFFDDEVVCLGSGIRSEEPHQTETIVENRKFDDENKIRIWADGKPLQAKHAGEISKVSWMLLDGDKAESGIGYVFPEKPGLKFLVETRTGSWSDINQYYPNPAPITKSYFTLYFEHGVSPKDAAYQYILLPGKSSRETEAYAGSPDVEILVNSPEVQAVREKKLGILSAHFWVDAAPPVGGLRTDKKSAVMVEENGENFRISVSDPTQQNQGTISVSYRTKIRGTLRLDPGVEVVESGPELKLLIRTKDAFGRTFSGEFQRAL